MKNVGFAVFALALCAPSFASADDAVARIKTVRGDAALVRNGQTLPAKVGDAVNERDLIRTRQGSLGLTFRDGTSFAAGPDTEVRIRQYNFDSSTVKGKLLARMHRGTLAVQTGELTRHVPEAVKIETPSAILGVRGTRFLVQVEREKKGFDDAD